MDEFRSVTHKPSDPRVVPLLLVTGMALSHSLKTHGFRLSTGWVLRLTMVIAAAGRFTFAASHPPGVSYPLRSADLQPSGLAQPLPSTRRYVLVWKDQLIPDSYSEVWKQWVVTHYVGTQKLFRRQIDDYRSRNPNFLMLVYHLAYGLNGADQPNPVGNITGPDSFGQEDTDTFTPWVAAHGINREAAYQHFANPPSTSTRVSYPDPFWLMDISSSEWRSYLFDSLLQWQAFPTTHATGVFLDVAFPPWYSYQPNDWWAGPAGDGSREGLRNWWNPRALDYFNAMRAAFAPSSDHPRYLVIPNTDALVDGIDEPAFLQGTDGVFTENWQAIGANSGDWNLSTRRVLQYVTSQGKVWMIDVTSEASNLSQSLRELLIGTYFLIRNGTSYVMFGNELSWYPEYELDLGGYQSEPPSDLEALRVSGQGGSAGGLYARTYQSGVVLVNSSDGALQYSLGTAMKRATWSGGGAIDAAANPPSYSLTYDQDVAAGNITVAARSVLFLRDPTGAPPPGVEGPVNGADGGSPDGGDAGHPSDGGWPDGGPLGTGSGGATLTGGACDSTHGFSLAAVVLSLLALLSRLRGSPARCQSRFAQARPMVAGARARPAGHWLDVLRVRQVGHLDDRVV